MPKITDLPTLTRLTSTDTIPVVQSSVTSKINLSEFGKRILSPSNVVGDGTTDDTATIQASLTAGGTTVLSVGTYIITAPLYIPSNSGLRINKGAILKASASFAGEAMVVIKKGDGANIAENVLIDGGGLIDGNLTAPIGIKVHFARYCQIQNMKIIQCPTHGIYVGATNSYDINIFGTQIWFHEITSGTPQRNTSDSIGIFYDTCTDSYITQTSVVGYRTGYKHLGGSIYYVQCHAWTRGTWQGAMTKGFDVGAGMCKLTQCYADTPTNIGKQDAEAAITDCYGFWISGYDVQMTDCCVFLNNTYGVDNLVTGVHFNSPTTYTRIFGMDFRAGPTYKLKKLFGGVKTKTTRLGIMTDGNTYSTDDLSDYTQYTIAVSGAKGDGTTDDTATIQSAINDVSTAGGGIVFLPKGTYKHTGLKLKTGVRLMGEGSSINDATKLTLANTSNTDSIGLFDANVRDVEVANLWIEGNKANQTSGHGINLTTGFYNPSNETYQGFTISNVKVTGAKQNGINLNSSVNQPNIGNIITDVELRSCGDNGLYLKYTTDTSILNMTASGNANAGVWVDTGTANNKFIKCKTYWNGTSYVSTKPYGWYINSPKRSTFIDCEAQEDYKYGMYILSPSICSFVGILVDANGREATPGVGARIYNADSCNFNISSTSFHSPTWQGVGVEIVSCIYCVFTLMNTVVPSAYTLTTSPECLLSINGISKITDGTFDSTNVVSGSAGALPANVAGYIRQFVNGTEVMIPYYNTSWFTSSDKLLDSYTPDIAIDITNDRYAVEGVTKTFSEVITFTRASKGWHFDNANQLVEAAIDEPRFMYNAGSKFILKEPERTNFIRNPRWEGAVTGTIGSGGAVSTYSGYSLRGLSMTVTAGISNNGIPTIRYRVFGTPASTGSIYITLEGIGNVAAVNGDSFTLSAWLRLAAGNFTNVSSPQFFMNTYNSSAAWLSNLGSPINWSTVTGSFARYFVSGTITNPATASVQPGTFQANVTSGFAVDFTIEIGGVQLEKGKYATTLILPPIGTPGATTRKADIVQIDSVVVSGVVQATEGTMLMSYIIPYNIDSTAAQNLCCLSDNSSSNFIDAKISGAGAPTLAVTSGGVSQISVSSSTYTVGTSSKLAIAYKTNDFAISQAGAGSAATSSTGTTPASITNIHLGGTFSDADLLSGGIGNIYYYPIRGHNKSLTRITT